MYGDKSFLAVIPARGGSKRLPGKNVLDLNANDGTLKVGAGVTIENTGEAQFVGIVTADQFAGDIVGATGTFSGNVSVGGTLTYEDVTSIDSVGIITARSGINVTGTVTADNFSGTDGSFIILNGGANNAFHVDGGAPASSLHVENGGEISVNTTLKVGTAIGIGTDTPRGSSKLDVEGLTKSRGFQATANQTPTAGHGVEIFAPSSSQGMIQAFDRTGGSQMELKFRGSDITFFGTSSTDERVRITGAGSVGINETTPDSKLDILHSTSTNTATENLIHLRTDPGSGYVTRGLFVKIGRDGVYDNSAAHYDIVGSDGNSGTHIFEVQGTEKLRITSAGNVTIGAKSYPNWHSSVDALTIGYAGCLYEDSYAVGGVAGRDNYAVLGNNTYYASSGGNTYINNDEASRIMMHGGDFYFQNASQGIAGNAITFNTRLKITSGGDLIQKERYYTYTNDSNVAGSQTRTLTITGLRYGTATIHFGGSDGNGQYVHFKINFGGMMWGAGNGYNAEVSSSGYVGGSYSVTKNNTSYVISITAGSNQMYYSYTFESTSYTANNYATIAET